MSLLASAASPTKRAAAATSAATADITSGGQPFYAAIYSGNGTKIWDGSFGASPPTTTTLAAVASVSKSLYAVWAAQHLTLGSTDWPYLTLTSGRDAMNGQQCQATSTETVDSCMITVGVGGIRYDTLNPLHVGKFAYDSAHMQYHADHFGGLSASTRSVLASGLRATFSLGVSDLTYTQPLLAGGVTCDPLALLTVCQNICNGTYNIKGLLQSNTFTAVNASTYFTDGSVIGSPAPSTEPWLYKWGFWVEPGGQYYWMSGSFGTSVWIKSDFSQYGIVFRVADGTGGEMGVQSIRTGQSIRTAYNTGRF